MISLILTKFGNILLHVISLQIIVFKSLDRFPKVQCFPMCFDILVICQCLMTNPFLLQVSFGHFPFLFFSALIKAMLVLKKIIAKGLYLLLLWTLIDRKAKSPSTPQLLMQLKWVANLRNAADDAWGMTKVWKEVF